MDDVYWTWSRRTVLEGGLRGKWIQVYVWQSPFAVLLKLLQHCSLTICCSVTRSGPTLCDPMDCSTPGFPVLHHLLESAQTHFHWADDAILPSHPLSSPSPSVLNLCQRQSLFQWVGSLHQVAKVSASASVLPMNILGWLPLGLTGLFSLQSKGLSRVFSILQYKIKC